jgi:hypothetical protein
MSMQEYFVNTKGTGILATANADGVVDLAVYARPHVLDEETISFIMRDRLSHTNLQSNPHAAYLFHEAGGGYKGKRLYLTKTGEETDPEKIAAVRRRQKPVGCTDEEGESQFLVTFHIDGTRPLVGDSE